MQSKLSYESDSESEDYPQNSNNQTSTELFNKRLVELNIKSNQNIQNEIEQEVQMLMKNHYMLQLNVQSPVCRTVNLLDQEEKEIYLQLFIDRKKQVQKRIEETKQNMDLLIKLQTQLYEVSQLQTSKLSHQEKNSSMVMENIKKQDQNFGSVIKKLQSSITYFQLQIDHYNQLIPQRIKSTFDHNSKPYQISQEQNKINNIIQIDDKDENGFIEEIKDESDQVSQNNNKSQINSSTQLPLQAFPQVMTRRKAQQLKSTQVIQKIESTNSSTVKESLKDQSSPIKNKQNQESIDNQSGKSHQPLLQNQQQNSKSNSELSNKSQKNEQSKVVSLNGQIENGNTSSQSTKVSHSSANSSSRFDGLKQQQSQKQPLSITLSSNNSSPKNSKNDMKTNIQQNGNQNKQQEEIVIKSDYEEQQDRFKNYNTQFKQLNEKLNMMKEEFEQIIYHLKTYQHNFCFSSSFKQNNFLDTQKAVVSQLDKCIYFLDGIKQYDEQINFIEDQFLYFSNSSDLTQNFQVFMKKKLKVTKQIVFQQNLQQNVNNTSSQTNKLEQKINETPKQQCLKYQDNLKQSENSENSNPIQIQKYEYMESLRQFYEPHAILFDHKQNIDNTTQQNINFDEKFFEESKSFFYAQENASRIEKLVQRYEQISKLSTKI